MAFLAKDPENTDVQPLPTDRGEFDRLIQPYAILVNPLLVGASGCLELVGSKPLTSQEIRGGTDAISAVFAQYFPGKFTDSRFLLLIWVLGTIAPRVLQFVAEKKKTAPKPTSGKITQAAVQDATAGAVAAEQPQAAVAL